MSDKNANNKIIADDKLNKVVGGKTEAMADVDYGDKYSKAQSLDKIFINDIKCQTKSNLKKDIYEKIYGK